MFHAEQGVSPTRHSLSMSYLTSVKVDYAVEEGESEKSSCCKSCNNSRILTLPNSDLPQTQILIFSNQLSTSNLQT